MNLPSVEYSRMFPPVNHTPAMMPDTGDATTDFHLNLKAADNHKQC